MQCLVIKLKASEWEQYVLDKTDEDVSEGAMSPIIDLDKDFLESVHLAGKIPVREMRNGQYRIRVVDHQSDNGVAAATWPQDAIIHQTVDALRMIFTSFVAAGQTCWMWKRDIGKAYRSIPIKLQHHVYSWVTFSFQGHAKAAAHYGMPFGAVSACWAYRRNGNVLEMMLRRRFRCPYSRYVGDLAGASLAGVAWTGGKVLTATSFLLGVVCVTQ